MKYSNEIVGMVAESLSLDHINPGKSFQDNGIDSLDVFTIFLAVEERYGIKLSEDEVSLVKSIDDLSSLLEKRNLEM